MVREEILEIALKAAVSAGNLLELHYNDLLNISTKESFRDIVTEVDKMAENKIIEILRGFDSNISILTEESGHVNGDSDNRFWVVDALDGTVNYVNHIPFYAVSIAFYENNMPIVGVIFNPSSNDLYYGGEGLGVFKNRNTLKIKDKNPQESLFTVSFSGKNYEPSKRNDEYILLGEINDLSRGCLRTGSAAINLAFLAEGKIGGCWGKANKLWDIAAGLLLSKLAGSKIKFKEVDNEKHLISYLATAPSSWDFIYKKVNKLLNME